MSFRPIDQMTADVIERFMVRDRVTGERLHALRNLRPVIISGLLLPPGSIVIAKPLPIAEGQPTPACSCCGDAATQGLFLYATDAGLKKFASDYLIIS